jgi:integrase
MPYARTADRLPAVLTGDEVTRFLKAVSDLKMRTLFITIYAAGPRVSEAVALTAKDIDSARMVIVIRQGKGRKDRYAMLSDQLLAILRNYWRHTRVPTVNSIRLALRRESDDALPHVRLAQVDLVGGHRIVPVKSFAWGGDPDVAPSTQRAATKFAQAAHFRQFRSFGLRHPLSACAAQFGRFVDR